MAILDDVMRLGPWWFRVGLARWMMVFGCLSAAWSHAAEIGSAAPADALRPDPYASIHAVEIHAVKGVQQVEGLGTLMKWVSDLGPGKPMMGLIAVLLCLAGPRLAGRLAIMLVLCLWLRELLAMVLQSPRPYWFGEGIRTFQTPPLTTPTFSLPSGHATAAAAFWFFLAAEVRRRWAWAIAVGLTGAVCVSRVYLGVHWVSDVVLGATLGTIWTLSFRAAEPRVTEHWSKLTLRARVGAALGLGLGLVVVSGLVQAWVLGRVPEGVWPPFGAAARQGSGAAWSGGSVCGMVLAWAAAVPWSVTGDSWRQRWRRLGFAAVPAAVYFLRPDGLRLSTYLPADAVALKWLVRFVAGAFMGWAAFYLLPRLWIRLGLAPGGTNSCPEDGAR